MRIKKLLAMLLAAAMALTLFAGCCSPSLLRLLLELLQDQYQNITVTAEDDLDATLRQAVSENDTFEDITAALAQALDKTVEFESLRSARAGDQTFSLVYRTGTDTQAIARQTYTDWNKILGSLPAGGRYLADLAVRKSGGGYYILVNVTVQKGSSSGGSGSHDGSGGGSEDENDGGGQPQPDPLLDYEWKDNDTVILVHTNEGLQKVFFREMGQEDSKLMTARAGGFAGITIKLDNNAKFEVTQTFGNSNLPFQGTLTSTDDAEDNATINISPKAMFLAISGAVSNINFGVTGDMEGTLLELPLWNAKALCAGVVAYTNTGTIENCHVTFKNKSKMIVNNDSSDVFMVNVGGIAGINDGSITNCSVTDGFIKVNVTTMITVTSVGGIAGVDNTLGNGHNSMITGSKVHDTSFEIIARKQSLNVGEIAGQSMASGKPTGDCSGNEFTVNGSSYVPGE